jgi:Tol biopolymer transport system component
MKREAEKGERYFENLRQLTFHGENAEAYWSYDGARLVFQHRGEGVPADQIYTMTAEGRGLTLVSAGTGKTTCSFYMPGDDRVIFASTHGASPAPPPKPDHSQGYVWPIHPEFDLWTSDSSGGNLRQLTDNPGYDAEAVLSPDGNWIVFTSTRDGDLDLYTMRTDGSQIVRVTSEVGYDGGAFFSPDSQRLVYRAHHPKDAKGLADYKRLLEADLVRPSKMEIFVCDVDGGNRVQVTNNGAANFAPYFHPDGKRILFSSNLGDPKGREFDIYMINIDGSGLKRITTAPGFDGFPMFSPDGKTLAFCSNRHQGKPGETNVYVVDWVE